MKEESGLKVAEFLLQIKAIELQPANPFTWASGWRSPIYCDNRKTLSYPKIRTYIRQQFVESILDHFGKPDIIAGVATGGIAIGALIAEELGVPFVYVRSSAKEHGLGNRVEGVMENGANVVVVEDLISTGKSSLNAVAALKEAGANVKGMVAIFSYGFDIATKNFEKAACDLITLSNYSNLLDQAHHSEYITDDQLKTLKEWRMDPEGWSEKFETAESNHSA